METVFRLQRLSVFTYNFVMKLSVITPTHNRMGLLEQLLVSLEAQTYPDFEVLVAVDGSTDGTLALLEAYKRRVPFTLEVLVLFGLGRAAARNAAIGRSSGEVLVFLDDDLTLSAEVLARHAAFHQVLKQHVAVGAVRFPDGVTRFPKSPDWMNFSGCNVSVARAAVQDLGGFDLRFAEYGGEDLELGYRLLRAGNRYKALHNAEVFHQGLRIPDVKKGYSAGFEAVQIAQKHGGNIAIQLGVHPGLLTAKRVAFNPLGRWLLGKRADFAFEEAYFRGAWDAWEQTKRQPE
jgi:glycosyltransferase involved in cell wall biosynthesis